ncbi:hypothetical protein [Winogradskyella forsetii]|uniref:hypothetical protein n=1 Tax=Winogradskyella forsetii TaxID=2686077 RepID=UPI0015BA1FEE|nr:hypothetical protein [Winogradskyella forsetii]
MSIIIFNREIKRLISKENHPVLNYVNEQFKNNKKHKSYFGFFESFLFQYGIVTVGYSPTLNGNKYIPYVNCKPRNIFREEKGIRNLSKNEHSLNECQKIIAQYIIENLKCLNVQNFENWNPESKYDTVI